MARIPRLQSVYQSWMIITKPRFLFLDGLRAGHIDFIGIETAALQLRKIIEAISYASLAAAQLRGEKLSRAIQDEWRADQVFQYMDRKKCLLLPRPGRFVSGFRLDPDVAPADVFLSAERYVDAYKRLHVYAHEIHPRSDHPFFGQEGFQRAMETIGRLHTSLRETIWRHHIQIGLDEYLDVNMGRNDRREPKFSKFRV